MSKRDKKLRSLINFFYLDDLLSLRDDFFVLFRCPIIFLCFGFSGEKKYNGSYNLKSKRLTEVLKFVNRVICSC